MYAYMYLNVPGPLSHSHHSLRYDAAQFIYVECPSTQQIIINMRKGTFLRGSISYIIIEYMCVYTGISMRFTIIYVQNYFLFACACVGRVVSKQAFPIYESNQLEYIQMAIIAIT